MSAIRAAHLQFTIIITYYNKLFHSHILHAQAIFVCVIHIMDINNLHIEVCIPKLKNTVNWNKE